MSVRTLNFATLTAFGSAANLASLANNAAKPLGAVDNSASPKPRAKVQLQITLNSTGVSATGTIEVYLLESMDNTLWTDGIDPASSSDVASSMKNAKLLRILNANANNQVVKEIVNLGTSADLPKYFSLAVKNLTGAAFAAATHDAKYALTTDEVA